jgi:hypothetical protein
MAISADVLSEVIFGVVETVSTIDVGTTSAD